MYCTRQGRGIIAMSQGNTGSGVGSRVISGQLSNVKSSPQAESPRNCGDLDAYGFYIRSINTNMEHFGEHTDISITMELGSFKTRGGVASNNIKSFEQFLEDLSKLNQIKNSDQVAVKSLWEQMQTILALTKKTDK